MQVRWHEFAVLALCLASAFSGRAAATDDHAMLERMVIQDCGSCHGLTMKGGLGRPLTPQALAHTDATSIASIILDGIPGTAMPRWRPLLTEEQALWMAEYLKSRTP